MDFTSLIIEMINPEFIIIAVLCFVLGLFLKRAERVPDWIIPFVILAFGIVFSILYGAIMLDMGFTPKSIIQGLIQGMLCAAVAVFINQSGKQIAKSKPPDEYKVEGTV